jgi:hypothetical protein
MATEKVMLRNMSTTKKRLRKRDKKAALKDFAAMLEQTARDAGELEQMAEACEISPDPDVRALAPLLRQRLGVG